MTFPNGAALKDPSGLFNSRLVGNARRAIDIHERDKVDEAALKDLIRAAVALNLMGKSKEGGKANAFTRVFCGGGTSSKDRDAHGRCDSVSN
jgi:hypothetical protein